MEFQEDIEKCLEVLRSGGIILYPTDTIWGIGCDATNEKAVERILELKKRPPEKSMIVLLAEERDVLQYVASPDMQVFDYLETVTKPTTVIYEGAIGLAENVVSEDGSVAIRIVQEIFCKTLIKRLRKPLVSTSANISGEPAPANFSSIAEEIKKGVNYVAHYRQDDNAVSQPSAIIKWTSNNPIIIRP
jgi:L-threonylcarbamoyladenylate synthase